MVSDFLFTLLYLEFYKNINLTVRNEVVGNFHSIFLIKRFFLHYYYYY